MAGEREQDEAFLAELAMLLSEDDVWTTSGHELQTGTTTADETLLLASQQLLSETERLLSTLEPAQHDGSVQVTTKVSSGNNMSEVLWTDRKRQIKNRQAAKRTDRYRQKRKCERETLHQHEKDLSAALSKLRAARAKKKTKTTPTSFLLTAWSVVAKREMEKRVEAEQQQRRLRADVVSRARLIHQMKALLPQSTMAHNTRFVSCGEIPTKAFEGEALLKTFLEQLDPLYAQTDEIYRDLRFKTSAPSTSMKYYPKRNADQVVEYFESTDVMVIPFSFEKAVDAMSLVMLSDFNGERYQKDVKDPDNTTAVRYKINYLCQSGETVSFAAYIATRRYMEANRVVFVWCMLMEGQGKFTGLHTNETGWVVVHPSTRVASTDLEECPWSSGEIYSRLIPTSLGGESSNIDRAEQFTKIAIKSSEEELKQITQVLDSLLLDSP